jgi:hypothetical protein
MSVRFHELHRLDGRVGVDDYRGHDRVVAGLREERLHHAVKHDIPRQLHPGVIEGHEVRRMRHYTVD